MKKNITTRQSPRLAPSASRQPMTIGLDLGDKTSRYCALNQQGEVAGEGSVATTRKAMTEKFGGRGRCRIAMEVGTHSPWLSRLLTGLGHEVIVALKRAATWGVMSASDPSAASRARASPSCASPRKATCICASCWCRART